MLLKRFAPMANAVIAYLIVLLFVDRLGGDYAPSLAMHSNSSCASPEQLEE